MSLIEKNRTLLDGQTFTWPDDGEQIGDIAKASIERYRFHTLSVSGAGTATITFDLGSGFQNLDALTNSSSTYTLPACTQIKADIGGGDIILSVTSFGEL